MLSLNHKKLNAWILAMDMLAAVYDACRKLPPNERYVLVDQLKRAALSISNNIAEGAARQSPLERRRFYEIARSSSVEVDNCFEAMARLGLLPGEHLEELNRYNEQIFKLLSKMMASSARLAGAGLALLLASIAGTFYLL